MTKYNDTSPPAEFSLDAEKSREEEAALDGIREREAPPEFDDSEDDDLDLAEGDVDDDDEVDDPDDDLEEDV